MPGFDARRLSLSDSRSCSSEEDPQPAYAHRRHASSTEHPYGDPEAYYHSAEYQHRFQLQQQRARAAAARPKSSSRPNSAIAKNHSRAEHASQVHQPPPTYDPHRSLEEYHRLLATHVPCEGDDRPVTDEDLASGNYILGCGGTVAAPLAYEEVSVTSAEGVTSTQLKPKRGQGYSCHHCKTTKEPLLLFFCSNLVKKGKNLKKCKKKYCESCLKRLYLPEFSEGGRYWHCPSCKRSCVCAHCTRVRNGVNARPVKRKLKKGEQPGSPTSMTDEPTMAHPSPDELQSMSDRIALAMRNAARQGNATGEEDPDALAIVNAITHPQNHPYPPPTHQQHGGIASHTGEIDMSEIEAQLLRQSREIEQEKQRTADLLRQARLARSLHAQQTGALPPTGMDVGPSPTSFLSASAGGSGPAAGDANQSAPMVTSPTPTAAPNVRARSPATINGSPMTISLMSPPPPSQSPPYLLPSLPSSLQPMAVSETPNAGFALSTPGGAGLSTYNLAPVRASGTSSSGLMSPLDMPMMTPSALDEMVSPSALQKSPMVNSSSTQDFPNFFLPSPLPNSTQLRWAQNQHAQR